MTTITNNNNNNNDNNNDNNTDNNTKHDNHNTNNDNNNGKNTKHDNNNTNNDNDNNNNNDLPYTMIILMLVVIVVVVIVVVVIGVTNHHIPCVLFVLCSDTRGLRNDKIQYKHCTVCIVTNPDLLPGDSLGGGPVGPTRPLHHIHHLLPQVDTTWNGENPNRLLGRPGETVRKKAKTKCNIG